MPNENRHWVDVTTKANAGVSQELDRVGVPGLTILCHPDPDRVGEQAALTGLLSGDGEHLSRVKPHFAAPTGGEPRSLTDSHLSRQPLRLTASSVGDLCLDPAGSPTRVVVDGSPVTQPREISRTDLENGVVLLLAQRVALLLHTLRPLSRRPPSFGLVGESDVMLSLRQEIERLADLDYPVLLRGESGTGKEIVARALYESGSRSAGPYVCVNAGAINPDLAAAELFGAAKGAFTGAARKRDGYFQRAHGGILFLDEIGTIPADVQGLLLRALETHEIQPVGAPDPLTVDVRLIYATDADLEAAIASGEFRSPLFHRLSSYELELPPLRARRGDIGRLFFHFLQEELKEIGEARRLEPTATDSDPWVPAELVAGLAAGPWPGNVRQLRNVVRQLVVASRGESKLRVPAKVGRFLRQSTALTNPEPESVPGAAENVSPTYRHPEEISDTELLEALREARWSVQAAAKALNVARPSLYKLMDKCPRVRKASELSHEEIIDAGARCEGQIECMAALLEVSRRGLQLRMTSLGLSK